MPLNSPAFVAFVLVFAVLMRLVGSAGWRSWVLLAAGLYFYSQWVPPGAVAGLLALLSAAFFAARWMAARPQHGRAILTAAVLLCLAPLVLLKYYNFFALEFHRLLAALGRVAPGESAWQIPWGFPVGFSFITFTLVSYLVDVYRGQWAAERSWSHLAVYVSFFPKLLAGPIERAGNFLAQWREGRPLDASRLAQGLQLILWGLFKKAVIADRLAALVDPAFDAPAFTIPVELVIAVYAFAFQIYCDFSGYTDIAAGAGKLLGVDFRPNFMRPYLSRSVAEFWSRRWHISLGTWFRDYLYIPLGGSRRGLFRTVLNVLLVFAVSGLWHAGMVDRVAGWNFILWGLLNGAYQGAAMVLQPLRERASAWRRRWIPSLPGVGVLQALFTFHFIAFTWIFFRSGSIDDAWLIVSRIGQNFSRLPLLMSFYNFRTFELMAAAALVILLLAVEILDERRSIWERLCTQPTAVRWAWYYGLLLALLVLGRWGETRFIYMQF